MSQKWANNVAVMSFFVRIQRTAFLAGNEFTYWSFHDHRIITTSIRGNSGHHLVVFRKTHWWPLKGASVWPPGFYLVAFCARGSTCGQHDPGKKRLVMVSWATPGVSRGCGTARCGRKQDAIRADWKPVLVSIQGCFKLGASSTDVTRESWRCLIAKGHSDLTTWLTCSRGIDQPLPEASNK